MLKRGSMGHIRPCRADERPAMLAIVNAAAEVFEFPVEAEGPQRAAR